MRLSHRATVSSCFGTWPASPAASGVVPNTAERIFTPEGPREQCATGCRTAAIGCLDCKGVLLQHMLPPLAQIRERRQRYVDKPAEIVEILHEGSKRARKIAVATMTEVRDAIKLEP